LLARHLFELFGRGHAPISRPVAHWPIRTYREQKSSRNSTEEENHDGRYAP
jgi:hypothetical protein